MSERYCIKTKTQPERRLGKTYTFTPDKLEGVGALAFVETPVLPDHLVDVKAQCKRNALGLVLPWPHTLSGKVHMEANS